MLHCGGGAARSGDVSSVRLVSYVPFDLLAYDDQICTLSAAFGVPPSGVCMRSRSPQTHGVRSCHHHDVGKIYGDGIRSVMSGNLAEIVSAPRGTRECRPADEALRGWCAQICWQNIVRVTATKARPACSDVCRSITLIKAVTMHLAQICIRCVTATPLTLGNMTAANHSCRLWQIASPAAAASEIISLRLRRLPPQRELGARRYPPPVRTPSTVIARS